MDHAEFTPALGFALLTPAYDALVRLATRERRWRDELMVQVAPENGEAILDVGCGTGTLAIMLKKRAPGARVVGLDPDPKVLALAARKAERAGVAIEWRIGFARDAAPTENEFDKAVSSLVLHQVPLQEKQAAVDAMLRAVRPGGEIHIADYCRQPSWLMRQLFRTIQVLDGPDNTQPSAEGAVEEILGTDAGPLEPSFVIKTPTGAISLFRKQKGGPVSRLNAPGAEQPRTEGNRLSD